MAKEISHEPDTRRYVLRIDGHGRQVQRNGEFHLHRGAKGLGQARLLVVNDDAQGCGSRTRGRTAAEQVKLLGELDPLLRRTQDFADVLVRRG